VSNGLILLVEDETFTAELTMACLRKGEGAAIEVVLAHDGMEAIDYLFHSELERVMNPRREPRSLAGERGKRRRQSAAPPLW
jgi:CheY-like chemotaxis protein